MLNIKCFDISKCYFVLHLKMMSFFFWMLSSMFNKSVQVKVLFDFIQILNSFFFFLNPIYYFMFLQLSNFFSKHFIVLQFFKSAIHGLVLSNNNIQKSKALKMNKRAETLVLLNK